VELVEVEVVELVEVVDEVVEEVEVEVVVELEVVVGCPDWTYSKLANKLTKFSAEATLAN